MSPVNILIYDHAQSIVRGVKNILHQNKIGFSLNSNQQIKLTMLLMDIGLIVSAAYSDLLKKQHHYSYTMHHKAQNYQFDIVSCCHYWFIM